MVTTWLSRGLRASRMKDNCFLVPKRGRSIPSSTTSAKYAGFLEELNVLPSPSQSGQATSSQRAHSPGQSILQKGFSGGELATEITHSLVSYALSNIFPGILMPSFHQQEKQADVYYLKILAMGQILNLFLSACPYLSRWHHQKREI